MAFAVRNAQPAEENNVPAGKEHKASAKPSLLQQGSKRRAPLGEISNIGLGHHRSAKEKGDAAAKPTTRATAAAAVAAHVAPAALLTAVPSPPAEPLPRPVPPRTRSQTAAMRQQGVSMSSMLEQRSDQALATSRSRPASTSSPSPPLVDIDRADHGDPLAAVEYVNDIYSWYRRAEPRFRVKPDYISGQKDVNEKMRAILFDWMVEVHVNFKLMPESLYLTVNLVDRFLELKQVNRKSLQLVGVTAMLIASKYEEIWAPEVKDFVHISDKAYSREEILSMEKLMLNTLKFNLTLPTHYKFLTRYLKAAGVDKDRDLCALATYLVELSLIDYGMLRFSYSAIACAAVYTAMRASNKTQPFTRALASHSGYSEASTLPVAAALVELMQAASTASLTAVHKKYCTTKYLEVAKRPAPFRIIQEAAEL